MKVKVIDLDAYFSRVNPEYVPFPSKLAVVVGIKKGKGKHKGHVILVDTDAVHEIRNPNEKYTIALHSASVVDGKRAIGLMPVASTGTLVEDLVNMEGAEISFVELGSFVRRFGSRIEGNYNTLLKSIKEVGLNPEDYPRNVKELKTTDLEAEQKHFI